MPRIQHIRVAKDRVSVLSPLEQRVLNTLWKIKKARTRELHASLRSRGIPLTSVAVILDRLYKKQLVSRSISHGRGGSYYIYTPLLSRRGFEKSVVEECVDRLITTFGSAAVNYFNERFPEKRKKKR